jgi:hypothetical protein
MVTIDNLEDDDAAEDTIDNNMQVSDDDAADEKRIEE